MKSKIDIKDVLQRADPCVSSIFKQGNLMKMSGVQSEYIAKFEQHCLLKVDQNGTTAAAITAAGATRGGAAREPQFRRITFDHTFYMLIEYGNTLLFAAKIGQPPVSTSSSEYTPGAVKSGAVKSRVLASVTYNGEQVLLDFIPTTKLNKDVIEGEQLETRQWALDDVKHILTCHVEAKWLFEIAVVNHSTQNLHLKWVYEDEYGEEDQEDLAEEVKTVPMRGTYLCHYPLKKDDDEKPDAYLLKDAQNKTLFRVELVVGKLPAETADSPAP
jgi:hypothetical protein